jgi:hypothetical protein
MFNHARKHAAQVENAQNEICNVAAYMWNHAKCTLPDLVIRDYEEFARQLPPLQRSAPMIPANDTGHYSRKGSYNFRWAGCDIELQNVDLAPPCVFLACNYAR